MPKLLASMMALCLVSTSSLLLLSDSRAAAKNLSSRSIGSVSNKAAEDKTNQVWIGKKDAATSCDKKSGISLDAMGLELTKVGVHVLKKKKIHDSKQRIAMCGIDKGTMNGFLIPKKDLEKALSLGFLNFKDMPQ